MLLIKPSRENTSIDVVLTDILVLIFKISSEKQISSWNKDCPIFLIAKVIFENISKK